MRMIERWFPCAEVSDASEGGWGSGKSEKALFIWFAARPLAQAKAAVLTSLLPWPSDTREQERLKRLVREAMTGRDAAHDDLVAELKRTYPNGASLLDPFSGRAMIPLEAARLGVKAWGIDYSPVATLAGTLLADYPLRDWSSEPPLPFGRPAGLVEDRLVADVERVLDEVGRRYTTSMAEFYPKVNGRQPWGYLWAVTLPCQDCGRRFPVTGSLTLRHSMQAKHDPGQAYQLLVDPAADTFTAVVHDGPPRAQPTLVNLVRAGQKIPGRTAVCPFCSHAHPLQVHRRLAKEGLGRDVLLVAADLDAQVGKSFRQPTDFEIQAASLAEASLADESPIGGLPAVPRERIPVGNSRFMSPLVYGAKTYGDLCNPRQTLGFVRLSRVIGQIATDLASSGLSADYVSALSGYAASVLVRKLKYSTRGSTLRAHHQAKSNNVQVDHIFANEASVTFAYDYFETALGEGPGGWSSLAHDTLSVLRNQATRPPGRRGLISQGTATALPLRDGSMDAVVTDPPYESMIPYTDVSDMFYVWLRRALAGVSNDFAITADPDGLQEKALEIIVKRTNRIATGEHRTQAFYDRSLAQALTEARRVLHPDGVVTIVFGHGDPEVWHRLLVAITAGGLVLTGSWPAKTETGGGAGSSNIVTTLTLACRAAPATRPAGRIDTVDDEVRHEVRARVPEWERANLALTDQLMASAGPAMEIVGRYSAVLDQLGEPIDTTRYLVLARRVVEEAAAIKIEDLPLETFDSRTRFALFWARLYGRGLAAKSEARWQAMVSDIALAEIDDILREAEGGKGVRLAFGREARRVIDETSSVIDIALAVARAWPDGLNAVAEILAAAQRDSEDPHLWAAIRFLSARLPEADPDVQAWNGIVRGKRGVASATLAVVREHSARVAKQRQSDDQMRLFEVEEGGGEG